MTDKIDTIDLVELKLGSSDGVNYKNLELRITFATISSSAPTGFRWISYRHISEGKEC